MKTKVFRVPRKHDFKVPSKRTEKNVSIEWRNYVICLKYYGENMINIIDHEI